jgi:hypothetical protein
VDKLSRPDEPNVVEPATGLTASPRGPEGTPSEDTAQPDGPSRPTRAEALTAKVRETLATLDAKRPEHASIEVGFRWPLRDREIAGGVLGGGLAYRFFFWALSWSVLTAGGLGFVSRSGNLNSAVQEAGLGDSTADVVAIAGQQAESGRVWLLIVGVWLVLWFSWGLLRALWLTHAAAWRMRPPSISNVEAALA